MSRTPLPLVVPDATRFARLLGQSLRDRHTAGEPPPGHVQLLNLMARALGHRNLQSLRAALGHERALGSADLPVATPGNGAPRVRLDRANTAVDDPDRHMASDGIAHVEHQGHGHDDERGNDTATEPSTAEDQALHLPAAPLAPEDRPDALPLSATARKALLQFDSRDRLIRWPNKYSVQRLAMWLLWARFDLRRRYTEAEVNALLKAANDFGDHVTLRRELVNHQLLARTPDCREYRKLAAEPDEEARALLQAWRLRRLRRQSPQSEPSGTLA